MVPLTTPLIATEHGPLSVSRRRLGNLAVFLVVGTAAAAAGYLPWQVPALLIPWIAAVWVAGQLIYRAASPGASQWIETLSYALDAFLLTVVCFYLGGATWIASAFYVLLVITAAASLPMPNAALVAGAAWVGFAWLTLGEAMAWIRLPDFAYTAATDTSPSFAVLTVVIQGTTLVLALLLQQALLGALRRSEARHRAILGAASDMVVVLDREGVIQGASEVFAEQTRFPIRSLVGTAFSEMVDSRHHDLWATQLRASVTGQQASFELAYRSKHGNQGWISGTLVPLPPESGEERVLLIARDVSAEHRSTGAREAELTGEVASARLAKLDAAAREMVREMDVRLRKVLHDVSAAELAIEDGDAQAALRTVARELDEARGKAQELVDRLDALKAVRGRDSSPRKRFSA